MGKNKNKNNNKNVLPLVSVCTPTFNRRPFIPSLIKCYNNQVYPKDRMEWIIVDDGFDKIEDLVKDIPNVKYIYLEKKVKLGKKRNIMHSYCNGDIIVYMDDDDYYPPTRVSHAVEKLLENPKILVAGSSEMYIYFKHVQKLYQFGPYGKSHATAGTFAFRKELLKKSYYNEEKSLAEEKEFLNNYTYPMVQLDPKHVILVFSHNHNTFDKKRLIEDDFNPNYAKESEKSIDEFIKEPDLKQWFLYDIENELENYEPGLPKYKPDVLEQIKKTQDLINQRKEQMNNFIILNRPGHDPITLSKEDAIGFLNEQQNKIKQLFDQNKRLQEICDKQQKQINELLSPKYNDTKAIAQNLNL